MRIINALGRLIDYAERTKVEWADDGVAEDLGKWWNEHDFQPWI